MKFITSMFLVICLISVYFASVEACNKCGVYPCGCASSGLGYQSVQPVVSPVVQPTYQQFQYVVPNYVPNNLGYYVSTLKLITENKQFSFFFPRDHTI